MMKNKTLPLAVLICGFILLSGCMGQGKSQEKPTTQSPPKTTQKPVTQPPSAITQTPPTTQPPVQTTQAPTTTQPPGMHTFTIEEVSTHNTRNDCWLVIHDNVYDITQFISSHPGGSVIVMGCGKDATVFFETRPMGSGTAHSQRARDLLAKYFIGVLVKLCGLN